MKKFWLIVSVIILLYSCGMINQNTTIVNESSSQISFQWSTGHNIITLEPQQSESIGYSIYNVDDLKPTKRVMQKKHSDIITVSDIVPYELKVINSLSYAVSLSADGWMDILYIPANDENNGFIYTSTPRFSVLSSTYPTKAEFQFIDNICYVKIY